MNLKVLQNNWVALCANQQGVTVLVDCYNKGKINFIMNPIDTKSKVIEIEYNVEER